MSEIFTYDAPSPAASNEEESLDSYISQADGSSDNQLSQVWSDSPWLAEGASWTSNFGCQDPSGRWVIDLTMQSSLNSQSIRRLPKGVQFRAYSNFWGPFSRTTISQENIDSEPIRDDSFVAESIVLTARTEYQGGRQLLWIGDATCLHWNQTCAAITNGQKLRIDVSRDLVYLAAVAQRLFTYSALEY